MLSHLRVAAAPAMWGTTYAVATELLPPDRPLLAATVRALGAGLVLLAVARRLPTGDWWWRSAVLGALNIGAFFALLFVSAGALPGGLAAVLTSCQPLVVLALAPLVLGQAVRPQQVLLAATGVAGIALLVLQASARVDAVGVAAALGAALSSALGLVLTRRWRPPVGLVTATAWQLTAGGLLLAPLLLVVEGLPAAPSAAALVGFAWLVGPSTVGGYLLWFDGIARLPAAAVSGLGMISPVVAATVGWVLLGQSLTPAQVAGAAVALAAVALLQRPGPGGPESPTSRSVEVTPVGAGDYPARQRAVPPPQAAHSS